MIESGSIFDDEGDALLTAIKTEEPSTSSSTLSASQKARMEKNRLKAVSLKHARLLAHPYQKNSSSKSEENPLEKKVCEREKKLVDSGAGFFIEEGGEEDGNKGS